MKKQETWIKKRHTVVRNIAFCIISPLTKLKYHVSVDKENPVKDRQCLILYNHQTPFDQFFVGMSFPKPVYYLATEDIFSLGWVSSLLRWLLAPISIKKQTLDITAIKNCLKVAREGGSIALAPEGNRTYSGRTEYMKPAIASLARKLKLPIALFRIEGGYGKQPRWSDVIRKGRMRAGVAKVIEPEEYAELTNDELFKLIWDGLYVNDVEETERFFHKNRAEYMERAMYVCPFCGLSQFESHGSTVECLSCHRKVEYGEDLILKGLGEEFPFQYVSQWYDYQKDFMRELELAPYTDKPMYQEKASMFQVILNKRKQLLRKDADITLYGNRMVIDESKENALCLNFEDCYAVSVLGRNKLNVYTDNGVYQFKGSKRFNALKYVHIYYCGQNIIEEDGNGKFLGL